MSFGGGAPSQATTTLASSKFQQAVLYALKVHGGQFRKGNAVPYMAHLFAVASLVLEEGADEDVVIGALLHDSAEDQGGEARLRDVSGRFGPRVAEIVEACSDTLESPKPPWKQRKEGYLARLAAERDHDVLLVSLADKLHNARSLLRDLDAWEDEDTLWTRFHAGPERQLWYYRALLETYRGRVKSRIFQEFEDVVVQLEGRLGGPILGCPD